MVFSGKRYSPDIVSAIQNHAPVCKLQLCRWATDFISNKLAVEIKNKRKKDMIDKSQDEPTIWWPEDSACVTSVVCFWLDSDAESICSVE